MFTNEFNKKLLPPVFTDWVNREIGEILLDLRICEALMLHSSDVNMGEILLDLRICESTDAALMLHSSDANMGINSIGLNGSFSDFEMQVVGEGGQEPVHGTFC